MRAPALKGKRRQADRIAVVFEDRQMSYRCDLQSVGALLKKRGRSGIIGGYMSRTLSRNDRGFARGVKRAPPTFRWIILSAGAVKVDVEQAGTSSVLIKAAWSRGFR